MKKFPDLENVERGNTCKGVNRAILEHLLERGLELDGKAVFDVPCGDGEFLNSLKHFFPDAKTTGADIRQPAQFEHQFRLLDASVETGSTQSDEFTLITCISGVMEFDNTLSFFRALQSSLTSDGCLIVTNDNLLTVRDRLLYLLFGRFGQYKLISEFSAPTWKVLTLDNLERILFDAGLKVTEVRYVVGSWKDWLWLPLAAPLYLIQLCYLAVSVGGLSQKKLAAYPFSSMIARHYLLICEKSQAPPAEKPETLSST